MVRFTGLLFRKEFNLKYNRIILLKNNKECCLRNGSESDGPAVLDNFNLTHSQTDYLLSYPDENTFDSKQESKFCLLYTSCTDGSLCGKKTFSGGTEEGVCRCNGTGAHRILGQPFRGFSRLADFQFRNYPDMPRDGADRCIQ